MATAVPGACHLGPALTRPKSEKGLGIKPERISGFLLVAMRGLPVTAQSGERYEVRVEQWFQHDDNGLSVGHKGTSQVGIVTVVPHNHRKMGAIEDRCEVDATSAALKKYLRGPEPVNWLELRLPKSSNDEGLASIQGMIRLDGKPSGPARIFFHVGNEQLIGTRVQADGTFKVERLPVGTHKVTVETSFQSALPAKYTSEDESPLRVEVKKSGNQHDLELKSK